MLIKQMLIPNNTTLLTAEKLAESENGNELECALYKAHVTQNFDPFYAVLKTHLGIDTIADVVKEFVESSVMTDTVKGYVNLQGITRYIKHFFSYEELFRADFPGLFPAFYLNSDMWLMVETGKVIVLHHDATFNEVASNLLSKTETADSFNKAFTAAGSCVNIRQLIQLQTAWFDLGIINDRGADDEVQEEAALRIAQQVLDCSVDELENMMNQSGLDFAYQLCQMFIEDFDGFNQMRKT
ncbi:hypothetical protein QUF75_01935 [Desulfococcaceae bacterium HSG7]|nr:hypothetical protein [Desulfococcaceae bacterium HSG7]